MFLLVSFLISSLLNEVSLTSCTSIWFSKVHYLFVILFLIFLVNWNFKHLNINEFPMRNLSWEGHVVIHITFLLAFLISSLLNEVSLTSCTTIWFSKVHYLFAILFLIFLVNWNFKHLNINEFPMRNLSWEGHVVIHITFLLAFVFVTTMFMTCVKPMILLAMFYATYRIKWNFNSYNTSFAYTF
jgi:hypothetical protein